MPSGTHLTGLYISFHKRHFISDCSHSSRLCASSHILSPTSLASQGPMSLIGLVSGLFWFPASPCRINLRRSKPWYQGKGVSLFLCLQMHYKQGGLWLYILHLGRTLSMIYYRIIGYSGAYPWLQSVAIIYALDCRLSSSAYHLHFEVAIPFWCLHDTYITPRQDDCSSLLRTL